MNRHEVKLYLIHFEWIIYFYISNKTGKSKEWKYIYKLILKNNIILIVMHVIDGMKQWLVKHKITDRVAKFRYIKKHYSALIF